MASTVYVTNGCNVDAKHLSNAVWQIEFAQFLNFWSPAMGGFALRDRRRCTETRRFSSATGCVSR
jgi:hypothetical protein